MINKIILLSLFCFSCNKQYECAELKRDTTGIFKNDTLHIWFIYSNNQYNELMDTSKHGQFRCSKNNKIKFKKSDYDK